VSVRSGGLEVPSSNLGAPTDESPASVGLFSARHNAVVNEDELRERVRDAEEDVEQAEKRLEEVEQEIEEAKEHTGEASE